MKTLASKRKLSLKHNYRNYYKTSEYGLKALIIECPNPNKPGQTLSCPTGAQPIKRKAKTFIRDQINPWTPRYSTTELTQRLQADQCELCESNNQVQAHHIRKLADLKKRYRGRNEPPLWVKRMIARQRKTLVVCAKCHRAIHAGT